LSGKEQHKIRKRVHDRCARMSVRRAVRTTLSGGRTGDVEVRPRGAAVHARRERNRREHREEAEQPDEEQRVVDAERRDRGGERSSRQGDGSHRAKVEKVGRKGRRVAAVVVHFIPGLDTAILRSARVGRRAAGWKPRAASGVLCLGAAFRGGGASPKMSPTVMPDAI
jgi:hypothetical protein